MTEPAPETVTVISALNEIRIIFPARFLLELGDGRFGVRCSLTASEQLAETIIMAVRQAEEMGLET